MAKKRFKVSLDMGIDMELRPDPTRSYLTDSTKENIFDYDKEVNF